MLARYYPGLPLFSLDNFAHCPLNLIIKAVNEIHQEKLHYFAQNAIPVSLFATAYLKSQGSQEALPEWFNPHQRAIEKQGVEKILRREAAQTFDELHKAGRLVPWVFHHKSVYEQIKLILE